MLLLLFLLDEFSGYAYFYSEFLLNTAPKVFEEFKPNVAIPPYPDWYRKGSFWKDYAGMIAS